MKSMQSGKLIDGWEYALSKAQKKELFPLNKTWIDFYYEVWIAHLDDTIVSKNCVIGNKLDALYN